MESDKKAIFGAIANKYGLKVCIDFGEGEIWVGITDKAYANAKNLKKGDEVSVKFDKDKKVCFIQGIGKGDVVVNNENQSIDIERMSALKHAVSIANENHKEGEIISEEEVLRVAGRFLSFLKAG